MPNIEEFTAGNIDIRPTETGVEATARAGVRLAGYGSQIAEAYRQAGGALGQIADVAEQYVAHREINTGAKHAADFTANHTAAWNDFITGRDIPADAPGRDDQIAARINNPNIGKQWREQNLEPDLQQFAQGFLTPGGQQWASDFVNKYRDHMAARIAADQSSMAGAVIQANIEKTADAAANTVFNDPSSLRMNFDLLDHSISGSIQSSPTLSPEVAARVSTELKQRTEERLVQSAIQGAILKGGNWQAIASAYPQYVKPAENAMFERQARTQERADAAYSKQAEAYQRSIDRDNVEASRNRIWSDNFVGIDQETQKPIFKPDFAKQAAELPLRNPRAPNATETAHALLSIAENSVKPGKVITDPAVSSDLTGRMFSADNPTSTLDILKAEAAGKVTHPDGTILRDMVTARDEGPLKDPAVKAAMAAAKDRFTFAAGNAADDPFGSATYARFMDAFKKDYSRAATAPGGPPANALDMRDPKSLISQSMATARQPLQTILTTPPPAPATDTIAPAPVRPANYPKNAQWDANAKYWYVMQGDKKFRVDPVAQPTAAPPLMPQVPIR